MVAETISVVALLASFVATTVAILQNRQSDKISRIPILIITYDGKAERWNVRNVGNGPALNIIVAQQDERTDEWYNPVSVPAVSAGDAYILEWLKNEGDFSLGARYNDFSDYRNEGKYFTYTRGDRCTVHLRKRLPIYVMPVYPLPDVKRHWHKDLTWQRPSDQGKSSRIR